MIKDYKLEVYIHYFLVAYIKCKADKIPKIKEIMILD